MSLLLPSMLTTPLLKVPLLLSFSAFTYLGMTPPTPRPDERERQRVEKSGGLWRNFPALHMAAVAACKTALSTFALVEAATLVAQHTGLLPGDAHPLLASFSHVRPLTLTRAAAAGLLLGAFGGLTRMWCHHTLGKMFTWEVSLRDGHKLVTSGPYSIVRHPSYTGWLCIFSGTVLYMTSHGSLFLESGLWDTGLGKALLGGVFAWWSVITMGLLERHPHEDALMKKEFGSQWDEWAKKTPYRLIPFVY